MLNYEPIIDKLINRLPKRIAGDWIAPNSHYEADLCAQLGWTVCSSRYYDAEYDNLKIEIKKGKSIWLDLVRYAEIVVGIGDQDTVTAFFIPAKDRMTIKYIYFVPTENITAKLKLTPENAAIILKLKNEEGVAPRSLNMQASLTVNDIKELALKHFECAE